jgi:hypothetical protein
MHSDQINNVLITILKWPAAISVQSIWLQQGVAAGSLSVKAEEIQIDLNKR